MKNRSKVQVESIDKIRKDLSKHYKALYVAATGFGKGRILKMIAETLKDDMTMLVIVPRVNLVIDISQRTSGSIYCASLGKKDIGRITVATKQSLKEIKADLICLDEVHTYSEEFLHKVKNSCKYLIGLTGTPYTSDGYIYGENRFWNKPCFNMTTKECIKNGWLVDFKMNGSNLSFDTSKYRRIKRELTKNEISDILKTSKYEFQVKEFINICNLEKRIKVAVICSNIEHAEQVYSEILKYEKCHLVHSGLKNSNEISELYKKDNVRFSVSVIQLSEGYDNEYIDCIVLLRPTRSTRLAIQIYGRGLRLSKNKDYCLILDYAEVGINCGTPTSPIVPDTKNPAKEKSEESPIKQCEECYFIYEKSEHGHTCPSCGHFHKKDRDVEKNLKESLLEKEKIHEIIITRDNIYKYGKTKRGFQPFMTVKINGEFHTLFGYQYKATLAKMKISGTVCIKYTKEGKYKFKFVSVDSI